MRTVMRHRREPTGSGRVPPGSACTERDRVPARSGGSGRPRSQRNLRKPNGRYRSSDSASIARRELDRRGPGRNEASKEDVTSCRCCRGAHFAAAVAAIAARLVGAGGGRTTDDLWPWTSADPRQPDHRTTEVAMTVHHPAQPAAQNAMAGSGAAASAPSCSPAPAEQGGWTVRRLRLINDAAGVLCPLRDDRRRHCDSWLVG